jgi:lysophospholipase L1-like esterase
MNYSKGGCTVSYMLEHINEIRSADLYVIALGTNDVRYRDESVCAMTAESYVERMDELKTKLLSVSSGAKFIFIAPWYSTDGDIYSMLSFEDKTVMNEEYSAALEKYCSENSLMYINANPYIKNVLTVYPDRDYLLDHIHPNASKGVIMYSEAVLMS